MKPSGALVPVLAALTFALAPLSAAAQSSEQSLTAEANRVLARQEALSRLWPGYWPEGQPFILHDRAVGAVFAGAASPSGPSFRPGPLANADSGFELDYPTGAPNTVVLTVDRPDTDLETLFHEQFHDYQSDAFRWRGPGGGEYLDLSLIPDRAGFAAQVEVERRVLADALQARDDDSRKRLARTWLTLRRERLAALDGAVDVIEAEREWTEGTAFYVGLQASALVHDKGADAVRERLVAELQMNLAARPGGFVTNWFRWRAYGVGGAQAWLLDALGEDWRKPVEEGQRLDALLEQAVGRADHRLADNARRRYDLIGLREALVAALAAAPPVVSNRAEFLALAPRRLVLELAVPVARAGLMESSFQSEGMAALADGVIALPDAAYFVSSGEGTRLKTQGLSVLHEMPTIIRADAPARFRSTVLLDDLAGIEGLTGLSAGPHRLDDLHLRTPGLELDVLVPVEVEIGADEITVRPVIAP